MKSVNVYHKARYFYDGARSAINWWLKGQNPITDLRDFEQKKYSQNREDGMIDAVFKQIGTTNRYVVEFGAGNCTECCSRNLLENGWHGLRMDRDPQGNWQVKTEFITAENILYLFKKYVVPNSFDLLIIDVDGNDYWIWKAIKNYKPRLVVIEYNAHFLPDRAKTIRYDPKFKWVGDTKYYGASLLALTKLAREKGYVLIGVDARRLNAFFVKWDCVPGNFDISNKNYADFFTPSKYGPVVATGDWVDV